DTILTKIGIEEINYCTMAGAIDQKSTDNLLVQVKQQWSKIL
ncbi:unnamed protein product, partial [marine sediment metagenome]